MTLLTGVGGAEEEGLGAVEDELRALDLHDDAERTERWLVLCRSDSINRWRASDLDADPFGYATD